MSLDYIRKQIGFQNDGLKPFIDATLVIGRKLMLGRVVKINATWSNYHGREAVVTSMIVSGEKLLFLAMVTRHGTDAAAQDFLNDKADTRTYWPIDRLELTDRKVNL